MISSELILRQLAASDRGGPPTIVKTPVGGRDAGRRIANFGYGAYILKKLNFAVFFHFHCSN